jgi:hypothetical protein
MDFRQGLAALKGQTRARKAVFFIAQDFSRNRLACYMGHDEGIA